MKKLLQIIIFATLIKNTQAQVWSSLSSQPNDAVGVLFTDTINNLLYAGGQFTIAGTIPVNHIAKWDGNNWDSLGAGFNDRPVCITAYNNEIYAGGWFTASGTTSLSYIAKWNGVNWDQVDMGLDNAARCFAVYNGELYVGGAFTQAGGNSISYIAKWNGTTWSSVGSGVNDWVLSLYVYNGELYAGGWFTLTGGNSVSHIAKWNGVTWDSLGSGVDNPVLTMCEYNSKLYVGGGFLNAGNTTVNYIASWDGSQWSALNTGLDNSVYTLCVYNTELYVGGWFTSSGNIALNQIGRWNGISWNSLGNGINGTGVNALSPYGMDLCVADLIPTSTALFTWNNPPPSPPVAAFAVNDSIIGSGSCVKFINQSTGGSLTYYWSFPGGNPSSSVSDNPIVCYATPGSYSVTLIAANSADVDTLIKTTYILVDSIPKPINYSVSTDYVKIIARDIFDQFQDTLLYEVWYYKPLNYDSMVSPILWGVHGLGGNGNSEIGGELEPMADRRKALIVSATMHNNWYRCSEIMTHNSNPDTTCYYYEWAPNVMKQIYQHVLLREKRDSIPVHLIGFSAGGQFVTRYMLIRQGIQDSIPIMMAVSTNPHSYLFCVDTLNGMAMGYPWGLYGRDGVTCFHGTTASYDTIPFAFTCDEHIIQYYNENYAVLIGTGDNDTTGCSASLPFEQFQGCSRYERAKNFYHFSDSDAVVRGTTLKWQYQEIAGVGHNQTAMYNTKANPNDSSSIAETLLFDTPYHNVPSLAPVASFSSDTVIAHLPNTTINFYNNSINAISYLWDFGDSTTSTTTNSSHTYPSSLDTFTVTLTATNGTGCSNTVIKKDYIVVAYPNGVNEFGVSGLKFKVYPNPNNGTMQVDYNISENQKGIFEVYDLTGRKVLTHEMGTGKNSFTISESNLDNGIYFYQVISNNKRIAQNKLVIIKE